MRNHPRRTHVRNNVFTERGNVAHRKTLPGTEPEGRIRYGLRLWSDRLGLTGIADAVDFRTEGPYPIEYKVGDRRDWMHEAIQLCAQALCLEEMFSCDVPEGAIFYRGSQQRRVVVIDQELRQATKETVAAVRLLTENDSVPAPVHDHRCQHCSLKLLCLPDIVGARRRVGQLRARLYH